MSDTVKTTDLDTKGTYKLQCKVVLPDWEGFSAIGTFKVLGNLI